MAYPDSTQGFLLLVNLLALATLIMSDPAPGGPPDHPLVPGRQQRPASVLAWAWFGLTLALLLNVKLSSGFYAAALVVYFLIWRRNHLRDPGLWVAALIARIGLTPFVWWNATHNWATIRWAIYHGQGFGLVRQSLFASLRHAAVYLSPPVVLLILTTAAIPPFPPGATWRPRDGSLRRFQKIMETLGVNEALKNAGVQEGDTVAIGEFELEWQE